MESVTIIITNYNKGDYIKESIESALNQNYSNFDVLIIDDGSTDGSVDIIKSYQPNPKITLILQDNIGVIKTRNKAINSAKGEFILQLDGDDLLHPEYLSWTSPVLSGNSNVGIAFCKTELFGAKSGVWDLGEYSLLNQLTTNQIVVTALFRKKDFLRTNGYNDVFAKGYEDWDFWLSILELGLKGQEINKIGFYYRILPESRNSSFSKDAEFELKSMIFKHHQNLYLSNGLDSTNLLWKIRKKNSEIYDLKLVFTSLEYKLGKIILSPFRLIQKMFK